MAVPSQEKHNYISSRVDVAASQLIQDGTQNMKSSRTISDIVNATGKNDSYRERSPLSKAITKN